MRAPAPRGSRDFLDWPFFEPRHRALRRAARRLHRLRRARRDRPSRCRRAPAASWCARSARPACSKARSPPPDGDAVRHQFALGLSGARDARLARRARRFRLRHAGSRLRRDRHRRLARTASAPCCRRSRSRRMARRLRAVREGRRLRRRGDGVRPRGSKAIITCSTARRPGSPTAASPTSIRLFARTGEAPGARGISAFVVFPDDPGFSIAERIEVIAPHPLATLRFENCRIPGEPPARRARRRLQDRDADARHFPRFRRRRGARLRPARARRGARARHAQRKMFGGDARPICN